MTRCTRFTVGTGLTALIVGLGCQPAMAAPGDAPDWNDPAVTAARAAGVQQDAPKAAPKEKKKRRKRDRDEPADLDPKQDVDNASASDDAVRSVAGSDSEVLGSEIVVTGIRQSVEDSIERKRNARQIVDVVTSEDAGKLPDNNVVEAMSRITGVTVTRGQGRANGYTIRGLDGVQTTVNGVTAAGAGGRTLALESVPAELVKSVEVYKTRTADQIEGGIAGAVNVELRRPLDLRKGLTVAGSTLVGYNEVGDNWSPRGSLLVADRFETGIGEIGFLLNGAINRQYYEEPYNYTESPFMLGFDESRIRQSLPADIRDTAVAPYRAAYGINFGDRTSTSISGVLQWRPSGRLNFILEGSYFNEDYTDGYDSIYVRTREDYYNLRNVRVAPSGVLLGYDIFNTIPDENGNLANFGQILTGTNGGQSVGSSDTYRTNFETHYAVDGFSIDASAQYQWSNASYFSVGTEGSFKGVTNVRIDFDSPEVANNGPFFTFGGGSPTDLSGAVIRSLGDNSGFANNSTFSAQVDFTKQLTTDGLFRVGKMGFRFNQFDNRFGSSYRYAGWFDPAIQPALDSIPGVDVVTRNPQLPGGAPVSWIQLNSSQLWDNWPSVTQYIIANNPEFLDGPGRNRGVEEHFATPRPNVDDPFYVSDQQENTFATYATLDFAFRALVPIDGNIGARYVNTYSTIDGSNIRLGPPILGPDGTPIPGQFGPDETVTESLRGNFSNVLPSAFITAHFTDKLQLRASYSYNVQQPNLYALRNFRIIDYRNPEATVYAGNPNLRSTTTDDYNLALEWYYGNGGIISLTGFSKNQKGFIYETRQLAFVPEVNDVRFVQQPRNAGPGQTQGLEFQATGFFTFLPGILKNFGATANATWIPTATISLPNLISEEEGYELIERRAPFTSRWSYNLIGYYETPKFSARLAYNWRSEFQEGVDAVNESWIISSRAVGRLDGAINFTPFKFVTFSIEGQNLTKVIDRRFYYQYPELPVGVRAMGRTIQLGARVRF